MIRLRGGRTGSRETLSLAEIEACRLSRGSTKSSSRDGGQGGECTARLLGSTSTGNRGCAPGALSNVFYPGIIEVRVSSPFLSFSSTIRGLRGLGPEVTPHTKCRKNHCGSRTGRGKEVEMKERGRRRGRGESSEATRWRVSKSLRHFQHAMITPNWEQNVAISSIFIISM